MLTEIHISNLATIENIHLDLKSGTTVITGETGAGKSIMIDAIELALGERASQQFIRSGQDKMDICLCFDLSKLPKDSLENDFLNGSHDCIIRRTINSDGRSRSYINDMPVTLPVLRQFTENLVEIHGQHEHQSLLKPERQRELLDRYAQHLDLCKKVYILAQQYNEISNTLMQHKNKAQQSIEKQNYLQFQLREFENLQLQELEWNNLEIEHKKLTHAETIIQNLNSILVLLNQDEENNVIKMLSKASKSLEPLQHVHAQITNWFNNLNIANISLDDTASEITQYLESIEVNPARLQWVEQRIHAIHSLAQKYKINPNDIPQYTHKVSADLESLSSNENEIKTLEKEQESILQEYKLCAQKLSEGRKKAAKKLSADITKIIKTLALPQAQFNVVLELISLTDVSLSLQGSEKIIFMIQTNSGSTFQPLAKIASGGELSRISLAIQLATIEQYTIPTLIFDEVDVGVSGSTAELVGKLLSRLGQSHQVLCITHLPQVAAYGEHHLTVEKNSQKEQTFTQIRLLTISDKIKEIARMLGGIHITSTTLQHAQEMVEAAKA